MLGAIFAAALDNVRMSLSGSLSATSLGASTVTSTTRTWTVPAGSSGVIRFESVTPPPAGVIQYSKNGGAFISFVTNDTVTFANGDTIAIRATLSGGGFTATATLRDLSSSATFGPYSLVS